MTPPTRRVGGEPDALEGASPVRRAAARKPPAQKAGTAPRRRPCSTRRATPTGPDAAQDAIAEIHHLTKAPSSYEWVIETDVEACFDRLPHSLIGEEVRRRIADKRVLLLVRSFLKAGVMTETGRLQRNSDRHPARRDRLAAAREHRPLRAGPPIPGGPAGHEPPCWAPPISAPDGSSDLSDYPLRG
jgi:hypothetical protein